MRDCLSVSGQMRGRGGKGHLYKTGMDGRVKVHGYAEETYNVDE